MKEKILELWEVYKSKTFLVYITIGFLGVFLDVGLYILFTDLFEISPYIANLLSVFITLNNNYYWNTFINFKKKDKVIQRWLLFMAIGILGLLVSELLLHFFIESWDWNDVIAKCATIPIIAIIQYLLHKQFTYK